MPMPACCRSTVAPCAALYTMACTQSLAGPRLGLSGKCSLLQGMQLVQHPCTAACVQRALAG
jgi:hypothetical protein